MSMTTELAQRMKAAAIRAKAATEDYVANRISMSVCLSECEEFNNLSDGPDNIIALVEALEASEQNSDGVAGMVEHYETTISMLKSRIAELESQNEYIRKRYQELDLLIGKNILVMQAAIIEWQGTGDAKNGLAWIYNTLFGPGELPDEAEKDAQAYFDRKYAPIDEKLMELHRWFWEQQEKEKQAPLATGAAVEGE